MLLAGADAGVGMIVLLRLHCLGVGCTEGVATGMVLVVVGVVDIERVMRWLALVGSTLVGIVDGCTLGTAVSLVNWWNVAYCHWLF